METLFIDKHYQLVVECKQGSKKACYELYRLYSKARLNVAFRQETTFGLWLKQIVVNKAVNLLRKRKMEWAELEEGELENIADNVPEDDDELLYKVAQIKETMKELPEGYRLVLSLYLLEGYDHEEIGQILNIAENTSRTQFLRAKRKLVELLKRKEVVG